MRGERRRVFAAFCFASSVLVDGSGARAQTAGSTAPDPLAPARALFAEALRDQEAQRFSEALEKFQRVRAVRDTASIEYRIGACFEGLGQRPPAFVAYREATALGEGDPQSADVVTAAADRLQALAKHMGQVTLVMPSRAPANVEVRIDDAPVSPAAVARPIPLEPGTHAVMVTGTGAAPFRSEVVLSEGAQASLPVSLVLLGTRSAPGVAPEEASVGPARTVGWITIASGGALLATSAVLLAVRQGDIATLNGACPGGVCGAGANEPALLSTRSRALVEGPLGVALGIAGVVAAGVGTVLVLTAKGTRVVPLLALDAGGVAVSGVFQ